jgi:hypothetical protein
MPCDFGHFKSLSPNTVSKVMNMVQYNKNVHIQGKEVTGQLLYYLNPHLPFFYTLQNIINIEKQQIQMYNFIVFGLTRSGSTNTRSTTLEAV